MINLVLTNVLRDRPFFRRKLAGNRYHNIGPRFRFRLREPGIRDGVEQQGPGIDFTKLRFWPKTFPQILDEFPPQHNNYKLIMAIIKH
jgi:hypothetical protein